MCDGTLCAADLADTLDEQPTQTALRTHVQDLSGDEFDTDCVSRLVGSLVGYLNDDNAYTERMMWGALKSLATAYPWVVARQFETVVGAISLDGDDVATEGFGSVVNVLFEQNTIPENVFRRSHANTLRQADPKECRQAAVYVYLQLGTKNALENLLETADFEVDSVSSVAIDAISEIIQNAIADLRVPELDPVDTEEAALVVRFAAYNEVEYLHDYKSDLLELLGTVNADVAIVGLSQLLRCPTIDTDDLVAELVDVVEIDDGSHEETVELVDGLERAEDAFESLVEAGRADSCLEYVIKHSEKWLSGDSVELHEHGLQQLRVLTERKPELVSEHVDTVASLVGADDDNSSLAREVLTRYGQARSTDTLSYVKEWVRDRNGGSIVAFLANTVGCIRYRRPGTTNYERVEIKDPTARALSSIADAANEERTMPVIWPSYEPRVAVLVGLELALRSLMTGNDVVVFSPGGKHHWGNKTELRKEYSNYAIDDSDSGPVPISKTISHAIFKNGTTKSKSGGEADTNLVFSKKFRELRDASSLDTVVFNFGARTQGNYESELDELIESHPKVGFVPLYSDYTKHETEERRVPRYGPPKDLGDTDTIPGIDALEAALELRSCERSHISDFSTSLNRAAKLQQLTIRCVDDEGLLDYLEPGYSASTELREYDEDRAAGRIFSRQMMIERFPVPAERYDEWVYIQRDGYFGPRTTTSLIDKLNEQAEDIIGQAAVAQNLFKTANALQRAREHIAQSNPLYDELCALLEESLSNGEDVAVFLPKKTWKRAAKEILLEDDVVSRSEIESGKVRFVTPDTARGLEHRDTMFLIGPQRPQYAGFYVHPSVDETVVVTYRDEWVSMIERNAEQVIETRNATTPGIDYSPYGVPDLSTELLYEPEPLEEATPEPEAPSAPAAPSEPSTAPTSNNTTSATTDREKLAELFDQSRSVDYNSGGSSRYDDWDRPKYDILTSGGKRIERRDRVLRRRPNPSPSEGRYHWVSPRSLHEGDQIRIIDEDVFREHWNEWLNEIYEEELEETDTVRDLHTWHHSLSEVLEEGKAELGVDDLTDKQIEQVLQRETRDIDREPETIWRWFESVEQAEEPLDLSRDPSLTIGPRRAEDIHALGHQLGIKDLTGDAAAQIEESMGRIRGVNVREGHQFRVHVKKQMNSLDDNEILEHSMLYEVSSVTEV